MNLSDYGRSVIRTLVPLLVGSVVGWLATRGVKIDATAATAIIDTAIGGLYYVAVRAAEKRWPSLGWLLGAKGAPSYASPVSATTSVAIPSASSGPVSDLVGIMRAAAPSDSTGA